MDTTELNELTIAIEALRQDLAAYRIALETRLRRRQAAWLSVLAGVVMVGVMVVGALWYGVVESDRRQRLVLETAYAATCNEVRQVELVLAEYFTARIGDVEPDSDTADHLADVADRLVGSPCPSLGLR